MGSERDPKARKPTEGREGALRVGVKPRVPGERWKAIKQWFRDTLRRGSNQEVEDLTRDYVSDLERAIHAKVNQPVIDNERMEAEIQQRLSEKQLNQIQANREARLTPAEERRVLAEAEKLEAEAESIRQTTKIERLEKGLELRKRLKEAGFEVTPVTDEDDLLNGLFVARPKDDSTTHTLTVVPTPPGKTDDPGDD